MKIENLKINAYGKLEEKEMEFSDHINIVHGKNESGKSTLLKFISNIFYGTSKNKKGKEFSDYDRYKPWKTDEFSGKLAYKLDNGEKFEVFREFGGKKNPKIYNEQKEDISKQFTIDKTYGNQFFVEQTGVDETMFLSTLVSMQQEVKIDKNIQNALVQKVANLASTGDDSISYKKAQEKITKKQIEEIGSSRSQGRPINIVKEEIFKIQDEIGELEEYKDRQQEIEELKQTIGEKIEKDEENLNIIKELKQLEESENLEKQKITINQSVINSNNEKIENLKIEKNKKEEEMSKINIEQHEKKAKTNTKKYLLFIILMVISAILIVALKYNKIALAIGIAFFIFSLIGLAISVIKYNKKMSLEEKKILEEVNRQNIQKQEIQNEIAQINTQIELLTKNNNEQIEKIRKQNNTLKLEIQNKKKNIFNKYGKNEEDYQNLSYELERLQSNINKSKLELHSLELDKNNIVPKLERVALLEEQLVELKQREQELEKDNEAIELAKEILEIAYKKMKQNITPKLTEELSKNIQKISNGKYSKINLHEEKGIIIEKENGEYIEAEKLSVRNNRPAILIIKTSNAKRTIN